MSNPVRGEQSWGAELMAWVAENLPNLLNGRQAGEESDALLALWEKWETDQGDAVADTLPAAPQLTQDETPETE